MIEHLYTYGPLVITLILLVGLHAVRETVNPIFAAIVAGVAKHAQEKAPAYGIATLFGLSASLSAFWDVFHTLSKEDFAAMSWHAYIAAWTKVLNPFIVAVLAYATQSKFKE